jgi:hypothetical protein
MALRRALAVGTGGGYEQIPDADTIRVSRIGALSGTGPASVVLENAAGNTATLSGGALTLGSGVALAAGGASPALSGFGTATFNTKVVTPEVESSGNLTLDAASGSNTTITMENSGAGALSVAIGGDMVVTGNLTVTGVMTTTGTASTSFTDNHLYLNAGYETAVAQTGGLVANYLPLSTNDTVAATGFVAGVAAVSNPTVKTAGSATFAVGQLIQIAGANNAANNGLFEVLSHVTTTLTIRGVGTTTTVEDFTDNQFVTDTTVAGTIRRVTVSVIRAGTDGVWETAAGSTTGLTFADLASATGTTLQQAYENGETIQLADAQGNLIIETDDTGTRADFILRNEAGTANYLATNSTSTRLDLGGASVGVNFIGTGAVTATGNPTFNFGTSQATFNGNVDALAGLDVQGNFTHGTTGSGDIDRPWDFSAGITNSAGEHLFSGGNLQLNDSIILSLGTGDDLRLRHDGSNSFIEQTGVGNLVIDNQNVTGFTNLDTGTDTAATGVRIRNNTGTTLFEVLGSGALAFTGSNIDLDPTGTFDLDMDATFAVRIGVSDNHAAAFLIEEGTSDYFLIVTTNGTESVKIGNATTNPTFMQLGTGQVSFVGNVDATGGLDVTGAALTTAAGFTQSGGVFAFTGSNIDLDPTGTFDLDMDATFAVRIGVSDNHAAAFLIEEGTSDYFLIVTTNGSESIKVGNATTNPTFMQLGTGLVSFVGNVDATGGLDVTGAALTTAAGFTQSGGAFAFTGSTFTLTPTGVITFNILDNSATSLRILEGANLYFGIDTTNTTEVLTFGNATTNPAFSFLGSGNATFGNNVLPDATGNDLGSTGARWDLFAQTGDFSGTVTISGGNLVFTGVAIDLDPTGAFTLDMDAGFTIALNMADNQAAAFALREGGLTDYFVVTTTNASESLVFGNTGTNPTYSFLGTGAASFGGTLAVTGNTTLTGDLAVNGGDLTSTATTFNLLDATVTTLNIGGAATTWDIGAATGTGTINNTTLTTKHVVPAATDTYELGSLTNGWLGLYLGGSVKVTDVDTGGATSLVARDTVMVDTAGDTLGKAGNGAAASFTAPLGITTAAVSPASTIPLAVAGVVSLALGTGQTIVRGESVRYQSTGGGGTAGKVEKATGTLVGGTLVSGDYEQTVAVALQTQGTPGGNFLARLVDRSAVILI